MPDDPSKQKNFQKRHQTHAKKPSFGKASNEARPKRLHSKAERPILGIEAIRAKAAVEPSLSRRVGGLFRQPFCGAYVTLSLSSVCHWLFLRPLSSFVAAVRRAYRRSPPGESFLSRPNHRPWFFAAAIGSALIAWLERGLAGHCRIPNPEGLAKRKQSKAKI